MSASNVESLSNARDSLPNVYTNVTARELDFVTRFGRNWEALRDIMGVARPIKKTSGTQLVSYSASVALESGSVGAGKVIPYSKATIVKSAYSDVTIEKYAKAVPIEDVSKYGAAIAVEKSDDAFLNQLQNTVLTKFYTFLNTGSMTNSQTSFQAALAMAKGLVLNKFKKMKKTVTEIVGFCNVLDFHTYLGSASITTQTEYGLTYVKNFMGYNTLFLMSDDEIARNRVIALPVENIDMYYVDPADSDFAKLGLEYAVDGDTNLIGFHVNGNYNTAVGESYAIMGITLWAEYLDGIAVVDTVSAGGSLGSLNTSTAAGTAAVGDTVVTISTTPVSGGTFWFKSASGTAPAAPSYLAEMDTTGWTQVENGDVVSSTNTHKYRIVELNGTGQAIATHDGTVTAKTS